MLDCALNFQVIVIPSLVLATHSPELVTDQTDDGRLCTSSRPFETRHRRRGTSQTHPPTALVPSLMPHFFLFLSTFPFQAMSFVTTVFSAPVYNFPIFLFGVLAQEASEAIQSLQTVRVAPCSHRVEDARPPLTRRAGRRLCSSHTFLPDQCFSTSSGWQPILKTGSRGL